MFRSSVKTYVRYLGNPDARPHTCLMILMLFAIQNLKAQSEFILPVFEHVSVNEGLSHSDAMAVTYDSDGFIWIGTNKGLDRFDGYKIKNYANKVDDKLSLSDNRIRSLYTDPSGTIWIGTESGGLNYYDKFKDRIVRINRSVDSSRYSSEILLLSKSYITSILQYDPQVLLIGTEDNGLFVLRHDSLNNIVSLQRPAIKEDTVRIKVTDIKCASDQFFVATATDGMFLLEQDFTLNRTSFPVLAIEALHVDNRKNLWVGANEQLYFLSRVSNYRQFEPINVGHVNSFPGLSSLHLDSDGRMWIGTSYGLYIIHWDGSFQKNHHVDHVEKFLPQDGILTSLNSGRVHQIIEDDSQIIWIATSAGGVNKVNLLSKRFGLIQRRPGQQSTLSSNYVNAIYVQGDNSFLWIAGRNGISKYDFNREAFTNYLSIEGDGNGTGIDVNSIFEDSHGNFWFGTWAEGLIWIPHNAKSPIRIRQKAYNSEEGLSNDNVLGIAEDGDGSIWVATFGGGLNKYDKNGNHLKTFSKSNSPIPSDKLIFIIYDRIRKVLWISTKDAGLLKVRPTSDGIQVENHLKHVPNDTLSLGANYAWPLCLDRKNDLWVGTLGGGLNKVVTDSLGAEHIQRYNSLLPESDVESIVEDSRGNLWIGGKGIMRFDPASKHYLMFDIADGLQSNSFKVGSAYKSKDGTLYFGGINGVNFFKPDEIRLNPYPPKIIIDGFKIFNKDIKIDEHVNGRVILDRNIELTEKIILKASENDFSINFVNLQLGTPGKNSCAFKLEPYHKDWVTLQPGQLSASFANLPSGLYTFLVKGRNGDGVWNPQPTKLLIEILPPWWKTSWAYTLYFCFLALALLIYRRIISTQRNLEKKLLIEKIQHEKDIQLNNLKSSFFTNVTHELRTPLTLILGPIEELVHSSGVLGSMNGKILLMQKQGRKLLDLVNQLMDFQKVESDKLTLHARMSNIVTFVNEIFLIFKLKAEEKNIKYSMVCDLEEVNMFFDHNKLEVVFVNLLSNAFKYTPEGEKIEVHLSVVGDCHLETIYKEGALLNNFVSIKIIDSGIGISSEELSKVFDAYYQATHTETMQIIGTGIGLSLVKKIIDRHCGQIEVRSEPGAGTEFHVKLALGKSHLLPNDLDMTAETRKYFLEVETRAHENITTDLTSEEAELFSNLKLLIVEDNGDILDYLKQLFDPFVHVDTAVDGKIGFQKALDIIPDLIISDIMMPNENGLFLCESVKRHLKTMHIPVLLLTARSATTHEMEGYEYGADDYIIKPFNSRVLRAKVLTILSNQVKIRDYYNRQILLQPTVPSIPDADREFLESAVKIVESNLEQTDFNVGALIHELGTSQSVFYRRLKGLTGQSAIEFITDIRMKRAAQWLKGSDLRVSEIAFKVGVDDVKYFRKLFHQRFGMSPTDFAKKNVDEGSLIKN